jgi:hypothetical protein
LKRSRKALSRAHSPGVPLLTANVLAVALRARQAEIRPPAPMSFHQDRDASTQHVEEGLHPSGIVEAIERAEIFGERPLGQPYLISHIELRSQFNSPSEPEEAMRVSTIPGGTG